MLTTQVVRTRKGRRAGFSLVELLISMALLGLVMAALMNVITRQQRFYRGAGEIMETRSQVRQGADILPAELRGLSGSGGDILAMGNASVDFRSTFGSSIACRTPTASSIAIPGPGQLAAGNTLTSWSDAPGVGDYVFIFDPGSRPGASDDRWITRRITGRATTVDPCVGTTYTGLGDATKSGVTLTLNVMLPATVTPGSPVRFWRRVRYALYQASDGNPYLGYCRSADAGTQCTNLQPVSGPYRALNNSSSTAGSNGLNFYYYDVNGLATTVPTSVARIEIALRAQSASRVSSGGSTAAFFKDTARVAVAIRNR
jgi:prepilin-type N-terminal cleavage/methylation domain-containing protein